MHDSFVADAAVPETPGISLSPGAEVPGYESGEAALLENCSRVFGACRGQS